jgi:hypothetical protein
MHVCFWIVGIETDRPFVALDLHDDETSELIGETQTRALPAMHPRSAARAIANDYAREHGATRVTHDLDSTQFSRKD